jgi:cell division protein FtsI (penicillin-binding protein 3)
VITKQRVGKERAIPVSWQSGVDPRDGYDLVTTLNVNMQDVVATALARACEHHKAKTGVAILMEVETGAIKAMANYSETFNHAVQSLVEPGSTFKLASIMAALEDGVIRPTDSVTTHGGLLRFHDYDMRDEANYGTLSVQKAVEKSSNVAIAKLINQNYQDRPRRFVDLLERIGAIRTTGIDLKGEPEPILTRPGSTTWSRVSLPWLATGYGVQLTPLQVLAFYNAIANNGAYTQPYIVQRIKGNSADQRTYEPRILQDRICSEKTLAAVRAMLEGVVEHGTARNIYKPDFRIAGKTGTAKIAVDGQYQKIYRSSFVGYFPADAPRYSCIVMIDQPQGGEIYGATVAAPVVREIADHVHAHLTTSRLRTLPPADPDKRVSLPITEAVYHEDVRTVYNKLNISAPNHPDSRYVRSKQKGEIVELSPLPVYAGRVPNVRGMSAKDALALLENMGLKVRLRGHGKVKYQSLGAGSRFRSNDLIELTLH